MEAAEEGAAPIPAPRDGADGVGGAAPGPQGREAPGYMSRRIDGVEAASFEGGVRWYCDVHRTRRYGEGFRITYTTDGLSFKNVDGFEEIPARSGDKVFVDTIPLQHTEGVIGLLRRGVEVYYLRRPTLIARKREELRLSKTARNDLRALMSIEEKWFRRVSEDFLVLRRMILAYRSLLRTHQQLVNKAKALSEIERIMLRPAISSIEKQMVETARRIAEEAGRRYPAYNVLLERLGINDGLAGREALAELLVYADFVNSSLRGLKRLMGLYRPVKSSRRKYCRLYDGRLHQATTRLAMAYYKNRPNGRQCWELVKKIKQLMVMAQAPG